GHRRGGGVPGELGGRLRPGSRPRGRRRVAGTVNPDPRVGAGGPVVCFGEMLLRLSPPGAVSLTQAGTLEVNVGGAEANVAAALGSLGTPSRMLTALPDNGLG